MSGQCARLLTTMETCGCPVTISNISKAPPSGHKNNCRSLWLTWRNLWSWLLIVMSTMIIVVESLLTTADGEIPGKSDHGKHAEMQSTSWIDQLSQQQHMDGPFVKYLCSTLHCTTTTFLYQHCNLGWIYMKMNLQLDLMTCRETCQDPHRPGLHCTISTFTGHVSKEKET